MSDVTVEPLGPGETVTVPAGELGRALHDAWIDYGSLRQDVGGTTFAGYIEIGGERYRYRALIEGSAGFHLEDEAMIGGTSVGDVKQRDGDLVVEGNFPGRIRVIRPSGAVQLESETWAYQLRRGREWAESRGVVCGAVAA